MGQTAECYFYRAEGRGDIDMNNFNALKNNKFILMVTWGA
jgi:hypothetical protein